MLEGFKSIKNFKITISHKPFRQNETKQNCSFLIIVKYKI